MEDEVLWKEEQVEQFEDMAWQEVSKQEAQREQVEDW